MKSPHVATSRKQETRTRNSTSFFSNCFYEFLTFISGKELNRTNFIVFCSPKVTMPPPLRPPPESSDPPREKSHERSKPQCGSLLSEFYSTFVLFVCCSICLLCHIISLITIGLAVFSGSAPSNLSFLRFHCADYLQRPKLCQLELQITPCTKGKGNLKEINNYCMLIAN